MTRPSTPRYPWGTETPGPRLRTACTKAQSGLEQVSTPGFHAIAEHVDAAVQAVRPLVDTAEYVARAGLRTRRGAEGAVPGKTVADAAGAVREALVELHMASALTQSACYEAFAGAVESLMRIAESGVEQGINGTGESDPDNPWEVFGA